jgi:hypothetical protein
MDSEKNIKVLLAVIHSYQVPKNEALQLNVVDHPLISLTQPTIAALLIEKDPELTYGLLGVPKPGPLIVCTKLAYQTWLSDCVTGQSW